MIDKASLNQTLVISGDRHRGGIYKFKNGDKVISEVTSSSLNASFPNEGGVRSFENRKHFY